MNRSSCIIASICHAPSTPRKLPHRALNSLNSSISYQNQLLAGVFIHYLATKKIAKRFHNLASNKTVHLTQINVPVGMSSFQAGGGISVQLPAGNSFRGKIEELSSLPGQGYLKDLAARSDIDWKRVEVVNKSWDYKKQGMTQEAAIIVAIIVTIFTAGAASSAGASLATSAGMTTTVVTATGATLYSILNSNTKCAAVEGSIKDSVRGIKA